MRKKVVQTDMDEDAYAFLLKTAESKGLTLKQALREAAMEWAAREGDLSFDPLFDFTITVAKGSRRYPDREDETLYGGEDS
ncbi:MAG: hypothetical protein A3K59_02380 [Euryarchaeota archaeon RBG_19FT_COMBO_69_17]|nr:MAG: hypothetical protein A3K59_02380 [Euryarchaeota archaeon RBG_19FT_COMBO_69_17]